MIKSDSLQDRQLSSYRQVWLKQHVSLKKEKLNVQIIHERHLNQIKGNILLET